MLINQVPGEECRIAIVEDGKLEELYHERATTELHVGNIYKARVVNVEPAIQAAFVDFGLERNGFLHITDLHPRYFPGQHKEETERVGFKTPHRERPPIQKCLRRGQEILVQVIKEGIGSKGPTVSSYLSIPGRFLVMMPHMERLGVSRKVEDEEERRAMRQILDGLSPPDGFGFIIRTAGMGRPKTELKRDLAYLVRLWKTMEERLKQPGIGELYTESDLLIRTIRDVFSSDIERIVVDDSAAAKRISDFLAVASPRARSSVLYYDDPVPIFHRYGVEKQIETIHGRRVPLPSGGSLVIDSAEALVAIDVNSGKSRQSNDAETTAFRTNQEACDEICRQLRLRDLGGVVVIDLIDMRDSKKRRTIEARFRDNLKRDRARTKPLPISQFGILEMTRQRMRPSITKSVFSDCHYCHGEGIIKSVDAVVLDVMRQLSLVIFRPEVKKVTVTVSPDVAFPLLNRKRGELVKLEEKYTTPIMVRVNSAGSIDFIEITAMDDRGTVLNIDPMAKFGEPKLQTVESLPVVDEFYDEEIAEIEEAERDQAAEGRGEVVGDGSGEAPAAQGEVAGAAVIPTGERGAAEGAGEGVGGRRRRRRRGGRRGRDGDAAPQPTGSTGQARGPANQDKAVERSDHVTSGWEGADEGDGMGEGSPMPAAPTEGALTEDGDAEQPIDEEIGGVNAEAQADRGDGEATGGESQGSAGAKPDGEPGQGGEGGGRRRRRRRGGRGRRGRGGPPQAGGQPGVAGSPGASGSQVEDHDAAAMEVGSPADDAGEPEPGNEADPRVDSASNAISDASLDAVDDNIGNVAGSDAPSTGIDAPPAGGKRRRRRGRRGRGGGGGSGQGNSGQPQPPERPAQSGKQAPASNQGNQQRPPQPPRPPQQRPPQSQQRPPQSQPPAQSETQSGSTGYEGGPLIRRHKPLRWPPRPR